MYTNQNQNFYLKLDFGLHIIVELESGGSPTYQVNISWIIKEIKYYTLQSLHVSSVRPGLIQHFLKSIY